MLQIFIHKVLTCTLPEHFVRVIMIGDGHADRFAQEIICDALVTYLSEAPKKPGTFFFSSMSDVVSS